ncbi:MAG: nitroreductase family protein [Saprospiraceae bacterium]|nr:nitroreductase family protein [Saprospiraceae bacterium]
MVKTAQTRLPVLDLIRNRWSARAFSEKNITDEQILTLIEAASWAPSANNEQPWRYRYALKESPGFQHMWECLLPGNQPWTRKAAALVLCTAKKNYTRNGQPNYYAMHDAGMANAFLILQATEMGIYGHIMAGFNKEKLQETFQLAEDETPVCLIALGFLGDPEQLDEPFKTRETTPRTRMAIEAIIPDSPQF